MKAYKAFNADLACRGFQYEIGKTYTMDEKPKLCERGFHAYKNLDDIFYYCTPVNKIRICEVELDGIIIADIDNNNDKYVSNKITILKEIDYTDPTHFFCRSYNHNYRDILQILHFLI